MKYKFNGRLILNTRPKRQAVALTQLLSINQYNVFDLPLLEIKPVVLKNNQSNYNILLNQTDILIFISANSVEYFFNNFELDKRVIVAVIGKSTAKLFKKVAGHDANIIPSSGSDSESLLEHPDLQDVKNKKVIIVRGVGGRDYLAEQLLKRYAYVDYFELYQRLCPEYELKCLFDLWNDKNIAFIIITSSESLNNLVTLNDRVKLPDFYKSNFIVIHQKIAKKIRQYGFSGNIKICKNTSNQAILELLEA